MLTLGLNFRRSYNWYASKLDVRIELEAGCRSDVMSWWSIAMKMMTKQTFTFRLMDHPIIVEDNDAAFTIKVRVIPPIRKGPDVSCSRIGWIATSCKGWQEPCQSWGAASRHRRRQGLLLQEEHILYPG
jgi:hypothetical protein